MDKRIGLGAGLLACAIGAAAAIVAVRPERPPAIGVIKVPTEAPQAPGWSVRCYPPGGAVACNWLLTRSSGVWRVQVILNIANLPSGALSRWIPPKQLAAMADRSGRSFFSPPDALGSIETRVVRPPAMGEVWQEVRGHLNAPFRDILMRSVDATDGRRMANLTMSVQGSVVSPDAVAQASAICHNLASEIGLAWPSSAPGSSATQPSPSSPRTGAEHRLPGGRSAPKGNTARLPFASVHLDQHEVPAPGLPNACIHFLWLRGVPLKCPQKGEILALGGAEVDSAGYAYLTGATRDTWTLVVSIGSWTASQPLPRPACQATDVAGTAGFPAQHTRSLTLVRWLNAPHPSSVTAMYSVYWKGPDMQPAREFTRIKDALCSGFHVDHLDPHDRKESEGGGGRP